MANKTLAKANRTRDLPEYRSDFAVYELSKPITRKKQKINFVVIGKIRNISGPPSLLAWASNAIGTIDPFNPLKNYGNMEISDVLAELGFTLDG